MLTYDEVGATAGELPAGYQHVRCSAVLGTGPATFARTAEALLTWEVQRRSGLRVRTGAPRAVVGARMSSGLGVGPLRLWAPCEVVAVVDEPRRKGFTYGTLPGHPARGEEAFTVVHEPDDTVVLHIVAFSRPANRLLALGAPISRLVQRRVTQRYLRALSGERRAQPPGSARQDRPRRP